MQEALNAVKARLLSPDLVRATIRRSDQERTTLRPIEVKGDRLVQVSTFDGLKTIVKNHGPKTLVQEIDLLLAAEPRSVHVLTASEEASLRTSRKGRPLLTVTRVKTALEPDLRHDRAVPRLFQEGFPDPYLQAAGLMTSDGRIKADRRRKFKQIEEFVRIVTESEDLTPPSESPILIVDFGCGNAYLTLALHYYLNEKLGVRTDLIGVDRNTELIERDHRKSAVFTQGGVSFVSSTIAGFKPPRSPDVVVALHACDTATDEALAQAVSAQAKMIFCAPCCHHHLQSQLSIENADPAFGALMREGIVKERLGDLVTDTFRTLLLRLHGYQVDIFEFTLPEHTPRNLMIRARRRRTTDQVQAKAEYVALKQAFNVTPYLETLLTPVGQS